MNLAMAYKLTDHSSLLVSSGPGIQNAATEGRCDFYVSLKGEY